MPLTLIKSVLWLLSLGVFGVLGWSLYDYKQQPELLQTTVTQEAQTTVLDPVPEPEPEVDDLADYAQVMANFHKLRWTGELPPPPPKEPTRVAQSEVKVTPVADLLSVLYIQVDTRNPAGSLAFVRFDNAALARDTADGQLRPGNALGSPHEHWSVESISAEEVVFELAVKEGEEVPEGGLETEALQPPTPLESGIVFVGPDGEVMLPPDLGFPNAPTEFTGYWPERTTEIRPGFRQIGSADSDEFGENYLDYINEVRHRQYRNPRNGKWEGIEILSVPSGSVASQNGLKSGDIIKSINGHPVNSVNEAITFAKDNSDAYDTWNVVIENAGRERTETYQTPD